MIIIRSFHVAADGITSSFFMAESYSHCVYIYNTFFTYSSVDGQFACFGVLAVVHSGTLSHKVLGSF